MKVIVNYDRCTGHGECVLESPAIFDLPEDSDQVKLLQEEPGEELRQEAERAVEACPMAALSLEG